MDNRSRKVFLPKEPQIRDRLTALAQEANTLRALLRLIRRRKSGNDISPTAPRQGVAGG